MTGVDMKLAEDACPRCDKAKAVYAPVCKACIGDYNRDRTNRLTDLRRELSDRPPQGREQERVALSRLLAAGDPAPDEFLQALRDR